MQWRSFKKTNMKLQKSAKWWPLSRYRYVNPWQYIWSEGIKWDIIRRLEFKTITERLQRFTSHFRWCRHQMEAFSGLLAICAGNSPVTGEFPTQRPVTRSFDISFDLCINKRLRKQSRRRWFATPSHSFWRHCNRNVLNEIRHVFFFF